MNSETTHIISELIRAGLLKDTLRVTEVVRFMDNKQFNKNQLSNNPNKREMLKARYNEDKKYKRLLTEFNTINVVKEKIQWVRNEPIE